MPQRVQVAIQCQHGFVLKGADDQIIGGGVEGGFYPFGFAVNGQAQGCAAVEFFGRAALVDDKAFQRHIQPGLVAAEFARGFFQNACGIGGKKLAYVR